MENQHQKIKGYRDLSQEEIDLMNEAKELAEKVGELVIKVTKQLFVESKGMTTEHHRWANIGKTDLQKGFMSVIRAIAKPTTF